jgi:hypothetical protein
MDTGTDIRKRTGSKGQKKKKIHGERMPETAQLEGKTTGTQEKDRHQHLEVRSMDTDNYE